VLIVLSVTLCLCAAAIAASVKVVRIAMGRFGLDPMTVMLWFGLAEKASPARTRRATVRERSARRRSPHRSLGRRAIRRRPPQPSA